LQKDSAPIRALQCGERGEKRVFRLYSKPPWHFQQGIDTLSGQIFLNKLELRGNPFWYQGSHGIAGGPINPHLV
jgi:hypothetical protein